jgi:hypothetical protein
MRLSTAEIAERLQIEVDVARGLVKLLVGWGLVRPVGERPSRTGRGRAEGVFMFVEGYEEDLALRLKVARLVD